MPPTQNGLPRALGVWGAGAFVVTNMVGAGIFTVPAFVRAAAGSGPAALAVWVTGAVLALCGALTYAELATRMPEAGGEYHYLARVYGPLWGFPERLDLASRRLLGSNRRGLTGRGRLRRRVGPGWDPQSRHSAAPRPKGQAPRRSWCSGSPSITAPECAVAACCRLRWAAWRLAAITALVLFGLASGRGDWRGLVTASESSGSWWVALIQVSFAYSGWNAAAYLAGEVKDPSRTLPRALVGGTIAVTVAYLALNIPVSLRPARQWLASRDCCRLRGGPSASSAVPARAP